MRSYNQGIILLYIPDGVEKIFDSRESDTSIWDAYYQGEKVPPSTLIYLCTTEVVMEMLRTAKGTVQVIY